MTISWAEQMTLRTWLYYVFAAARKSSVVALKLIATIFVLYFAIELTRTRQVPIVHFDRLFFGFMACTTLTASFILFGFSLSPRVELTDRGISLASLEKRFIDKKEIELVAIEVLAVVRVFEVRFVGTGTENCHVFYISNAEKLERLQVFLVQCGYKVVGQQRRDGGRLTPDR